MSESRYDEFVNLLRELPFAVWTATLSETISWKLLKPHSKSWEFGHFASLFIVLGLNDYQTKGKADVGYWPKVVPLIPRYTDPQNPLELIDILRPFYEAERFSKVKVERLGLFAKSELCNQVWNSPPTTTAAEFVDIWDRLGVTMNQKPTVKTIAFAMKCLAKALLMVDEFNFDFGAIPVPVDSRIRCLSARIGLPSSDDTTERERWAEALRRIRESTPQVTMVHLDTLLWEIGNLHRSGTEVYLDKVGAAALLAKRIAKLLGSIPSNIHETCGP